MSLVYCNLIQWLTLFGSTRFQIYSPLALQYLAQICLTILLGNHVVCVYCVNAIKDLILNQGWLEKQRPHGDLLRFPLKVSLQGFFRQQVVKFLKENAINYMYIGKVFEGMKDC